ncbi:MAG: nuclear transport factor 2 family protein [Chitinophagales bacterium]|nr:nuclear transport factor 2 family protein [Chitinophagales bacterium]
MILFCVIANRKAHAQSEPRYQPEPYVPESKELYDTIVKMDSLYFDTYNNCNLEKMSTLMAEDIEFYHDRGGVSTSKSEILDGIKKNICGKVTRTLTKGSVEVYPIKNYGAIEMGYHRFYKSAEPDETSKDSKFIVIWQQKDGSWKMTRVISLH